MGNMLFTKDALTKYQTGKLKNLELGLQLMIGRERYNSAQNRECLR
jgi:hypothetical protein